MIDYIKGEIADLAPARMLMECYGIGYEINISLTTFTAYQGKKEGKIYVYEVIREDAHHLQVPAWEICLALKQEISEEIQYIGIRAHDFVPVWDEISDEGKRNQEKANENLNNNRIPVKIESVAKLPFEHRFFLRISEKCREENVETEASENVCWFVQRDQWKMLEERGLPAWLYLPEEKILLLK